MHNQTTLKRIVLIASLVFAHAANTLAQMSTPGGFRVSETGAAVYEIPIKVPPGVAGMEPKLSLVYNSQSGNGLLGMGWNLQGLSAITRCPRTMAQDGVRGGVNYDANDRFCLDGQRLIAISGTYGADNTEYRTERESFTKIISYSTAGNGPSYFIAKTKAGQTIEYGNTADSKIEAQGKSSVRVWAVNKILDAKNNYLTVQYTEDSANGDFYATRIDYTGNAGASLTPAQSVRFTVQSRTDAAPAYVGGSVLKTLNRLSSVKTYIGESLVKSYQLTYDNNGAVGRTRLSSLQECDAGNICLPATTFQSEAVNLGFSGGQWNGQFNGTNPGSAWNWLGDFNGDGKTDIASWIPGTTTQLRMRLSDGPNFTTQSWSGQFNGTDPGSGWNWVGDFNGDGRADIASWISSTSIRMHLSTGTGFDVQVWSGQFNGTNPGSAWNWLGDFNGDGKTDIASWIPGTSTQIRMHLSGGSSFTIQDWSGEFNGTNPGSSWNWVGDFNGDGMADVASWNPSTGVTAIRMHLSNGSGFTWSNWAGQFNGYAGFNWLGDFNGDGRTDIASWISGTSTSIKIHLSTDVGFDAQTWTGQFNGTNPANEWNWLGDFNGDGKTDIASWNSSTGVSAIRVHLSTGAGFLNDNWAGQFNGFSGFNWLGDFNGDGKTDIASWISGTSTQIYMHRPAEYGDQLLSVNNGFATNTFSYKRLTDTTVSAVYTKDSDIGGNNAFVNLQFPMSVVSSATSSNGIGSSVQTKYFYRGLKAERGTGRGLLGFREVSATSVLSPLHSEDIKTVTTFGQDYPFTGLPCKMERHRVNTSGASLALLGATENVYGLRSADGTGSFGNVTLPVNWNACEQRYEASQPGNRRFFPFVSQSDEKSFELGGAFVNWVRTTNQFNDDFGNATQIDVTHRDSGGGTTGYGKTTTNTYTNDTSNWVLGRLIHSQVQSEMP